MSKKKRVEIKSEQDEMSQEGEPQASEEVADMNAEGGAQDSPDAQSDEPKLPPRDADFSKLDDEEAGPAHAKLKQDLSEYKDRYLRALADLENYKKRALKERSELLKYQGEKILFDMVEVMDNFERAMSHADADPAHLKSGLELIYGQLKDALQKWQVRGETAVGEVFDPEKHHALSKIPCGGVAAGIVINELKKAYFYKDRLLRAGEVVVAGDPPAQEVEHPVREPDSEASLVKEDDAGKEPEHAECGEMIKDTVADKSGSGQPDKDGKGGD